ncbi:hypothetical protein SprV_0100365500 [Sparganum proliferum]
MSEEDSNANGRVNSSGDQDNHEASEQIAIHVIDDANGARSFMPEELSLVRESSFKSILFEQKVKDLLRHILKANSPPEGIPKLFVKPSVHYPCCGLDASYHNPIQYYTGCASCSHNIKHLLDAGDPIAQLALTASRWLEVVGKTKTVPSAVEGKRAIPRVIGGHPLSTENCNAFYLNKLIVATTPFNILGRLARPGKNDINPKEYCAGQLTIDDPVSGEIHIYAPEHMEIEANSENPNSVTKLLVLPKEVDVADSAVWDSAKTLRANQDSQRQDDLRRMKYLTEFLVSLRSPTTDETILTPKQHPGGIFVRLEAEWRMKIGLTNSARLPSITRRPRICLNSIPFK